jgi:hypothetical protein
MGTALNRVESKEFEEDILLVLRINALLQDA